MSHIVNSPETPTDRPTRGVAKRLAAAAMAVAAGTAGALVAVAPAQAAPSWHNVMVRNTSMTTANRSVTVWRPSSSNPWGGWGCIPLSRTNWNSTGLYVAEGSLLNVQMWNDTRCTVKGYATTYYVPSYISTTNWWLDLKLR